MLAIELVYFLVVIAICLVIYFKAKELHTISQHRGLYYFKNIFLYFSLSYSFRLLHMALILSEEVFPVDFSLLVPRLTLFAVTYFSTMAILSIAMAAIIKNLKKSAGKRVPYLLHAIALVLSFPAAFSRSNATLILLQTLLLLGAVVFVFLEPQKGKRKLLSQNRMTYLLLAVFWIVNLLAFNRRLVPLYLKLPLYLLSIAVFVSIFLRVQKRLPKNAKKKGQA